MNQHDDATLTVRTLAEARAAVKSLQHKFGRECQACYDGIQYNGDPAAASTTTITCDTCGGTGFRWNK